MERDGPTTFERASLRGGNVDALPNATRRSASIPRRLIGERKLHLLPVYALLRTSALAREGIENSGSYRFADHIYCGRARGLYGIGHLLDAMLLRFPAARSFRNRFVHTRDTIVDEARRSDAAMVRVLSVPCGIAREMAEAAAVLRSDGRTADGRVQFVGIDIDPEPLALSRELVGDHDAFRFINGDALDPGTYPSELDVVVSTGFADFLDDETLVRFYGHCHGALRAGGVLATSSQQPQPLADFLMRELAELRPFYRTGDKLEDLLRAAGFADVMVRRDSVGLQALAVARKAFGEGAR